MSKELYRNVILILDNLPDNGVIFHREQEVKLLDNSILWSETHKWISHNVSHRIILPGTSDLSVQNPKGVEVIKQRLLDELKAIEKDEYVNQLHVKESKSNIRANNHGIIVAYIPLVISILATKPLPGHLYKWIAELIREVF